MTEEKKLPPEQVERFRRIRATMPQWGGGQHKTTPEAEEKLHANIGESMSKIMSGISKGDPTKVAPMRCLVCGAVEQRVGKRTVIVHDPEKHPHGKVPQSQLDIKPMRRSREHEDDDRIFGGDKSRETYNERLSAGRRRLGSGD